MQNSEHEIGATGPARAMHLSTEHSGRENWERRNQETMRRRKCYPSRWGSWIDGAEVSLRKKTKE
jgi:hypothetical protein